MKHVRLLILLTISIAKFANAQDILWEKKIGWNSSNEQFEDGVSISDTEFIALGLTDKFGLEINNVFYKGVALMRFDQNGDTSWLKSINIQGNSPKMIKTENDLLYIVTNIRYANPSYLKLTCVNFDGQVIFSIPIADTESLISVSRFAATNDGNLILVGSRRSIVGTGNQVDMYGIKLDYFGNVIWNNRFNANPNSGGNHVEENPYNEYLLSGNAGSRIWRIKVDSAGNVLENNFLYQTPSFVNFNERSKVFLGPFTANYLVGSIISTPSIGFICNNNKIGNQKNWGGESIGGLGSSYLNDNGDILFEKGGADSSFFWKVSEDSSIVWKLRMDGRMGSIGVGINKLVYLSDSTAIGLGVLVYYTSQAKDFYFCRISNVGVPYDPSLIVSNQPKIKGETLLPYPNPTESSLVFKGLKEEGQLYLFNLKGQVVKQMEIKPYQRVYLNDLPAGLYPYRVQTKKGHHVGRVVRN